MKRIYAILATVCLLCSCSDKQEFETSESFGADNVNTPYLSVENKGWSKKLHAKLADNKTFSSLDENAKNIFFKSVLFNSKGQVISFDLDFDKANISKTAYNNLLLDILDENVLEIVEDYNQSYIISNASNKTIITGNPPITYKNKRNNNVDGCDKNRDSVCVI